MPRRVDLLKRCETGTLYTPPTMSVEGGPLGTLMIPGAQGGTNWPGGAYDPETHKVFVFSKRVISLIGIIPNTNKEVSDFGYVHGVASVAPRAQVAMGSAARRARRPRQSGRGRGASRRGQARRAHHSGLAADQAALRDAVGDQPGDRPISAGRWRMARRRTISAIIPR